MLLDLSLLGEIKLGLEGKALENLCAEKTCALLIYLVVESERAHRRDSLAELLWPEKPQGAGRNSLKQALSQLRSALNDRENPDPFLITSNRDLQFNTQSDYRLDVFDYMDRIQVARGHCPDENKCCEDCIDLLEDAARLYRDEFLSDFYLADCPEFDEWVLAKKETYRRLQVDTLNKLIRTLEACGEFSKACKYAQELIKLEPWSETSHRLLMRLLAAAGNRSAALKQYHSCAAMLSNEFGVEPTPQTLKLNNEIKAWDQDSGQVTPDFSRSSHQDPGTEVFPRSDLRKWIILTASLCFLILVGVIYIALNPIGLFSMVPESKIESTFEVSTEDQSSTSPVIQSTSVPNIQEHEGLTESKDAALSPSDPDGEFAILPEAACLKGEELLYLEDFEDGEAQGWPVITFRAQDWEIINDPLRPGNMVLSRTSRYEGDASYTGMRFDQAVWRLRVMHEPNSISNIDWMRRDWPPYQLGESEVDWSTYSIWINFPGVHIDRVAQPGEDIALRWSHDSLKPREWHFFEISTYQGEIQLWIDGELFVRYQDPQPLGPGGLLIGTSMEFEPEKSSPVYFDDFIVCGLNDPFVSAYSE